MNIKRGGQYKSDRLSPEMGGGGIEVSRTKEYVHITTFKRLSKKQSQNDKLLHEVFGGDVFLLNTEEAIWLVDQIVEQIRELKNIRD